MKSIVLLIVLSFASNALAACLAPISRTNFSSLQVLGSARLNMEMNAVYARANEFPADCITSGSITTTQINDGTIANTDISASAAISISKTNYSVAIISDVKLFSEAGGTCTVGSPHVRDLNTEVDPDNIVTLAANKITLQAGTYSIEGVAAAFYVDDHRAILVNVTDTTDAVTGTTAISTAISGTSQTTSSLFGMFTITGPKDFYLMHECAATRATNGFGLPSGFGGNSVYSVLKITRVK